MKGRPNLYTDYRKETAILNTTTQKVWAGIGLISFIVSSFFFSQYWMYLITTALLTAVAAWGLNIVSGFAGQISLAHGVFIGIGTYVSAVLGGVGSSYIRGYELDMLIWLPLAGIVPALVGLLIAPLAVRLKGLNLGLVTLGLVYIGSYLFSNWKSVTGGAGLGRKTAKLTIFGIDFNDGFHLGTLHIEKNQFIYYTEFIKTIPYNILDVVARKYVIHFDCKCIFTDIKQELRKVNALKINYTTRVGDYTQNMD